MNNNKFLNCKSNKKGQNLEEQNHIKYDRIVLINYRKNWFLIITKFIGDKYNKVCFILSFFLVKKKLLLLRAKKCSFVNFSQIIDTRYSFNKYVFPLYREVVIDDKGHLDSSLLLGRKFSAFANGL